MPITYTTTQWPVRRFIDWRSKGKLVIPKHQRGYVWDSKHRTGLIDTINRGLPIPSITLSGQDISGTKYYIQDGQQRIETLKRFVENKFSLEGVFFSALGDDGQTDFLDYKIPVLIYSGATDEEHIEIFDRLQNGVILSYGERFHSMRFLSPLVQFTCETLLYEQGDLQEDCEYIWGERKLDEEKGDGTKRFRTLREAVCLMAGCLWGPEFFMESYDGLREKLRLSLTDVQKKKAEYLLKTIMKIYKKATDAKLNPEDDKISEKKRKDAFWAPKNFSGYILYSLWEHEEEEWATVMQKWIDFLIQYRKKPSVLKEKLVDISKGLKDPNIKFRAGWNSINNRYTNPRAQSTDSQEEDIDDE